MDELGTQETCGIGVGQALDTFYPDEIRRERMRTIVGYVSDTPRQ